jgi:hypothetical protein
VQESQANCDTDSYQPDQSSVYEKSDQRNHQAANSPVNGHDDMKRRYIEIISSSGMLL